MIYGFPQGVSSQNSNKSLNPPTVYASLLNQFETKSSFFYCKKGELSYSWPPSAASACGARFAKVRCVAGAHRGEQMTVRRWWMLDVGCWRLEVGVFLNGNWTGDFPMSWLRLERCISSWNFWGFSSQSSSHVSEFQGCKFWTSFLGRIKLDWCECMVRLRELPWKRVHEMTLVKTMQLVWG